MKRELRLQGTPRNDDALRRSPAWLAMGFRPFFLVAAAFAVVTTGMWLHALSTYPHPISDYLPMTSWHAHEMIFGFGLAVVAGFLLTAARNWTGQNTLHGFPLLVLVLIWLGGRVTMAVDVGGPAWIPAVVGVAFPGGLALVISRVLVRAKSKRNFGIAGVLWAITAAELLVHLDANGVLGGVALPAIYAALHGIVLLTVVIGGRIIPMFTHNRTDAPTRKVPSVDRAAIALAAAVGVLAVAALATGSKPVGVALAVVACVSGLVQLFRMRTWGTRAAMKVPMLAVLHAGYAWIGVGHLVLAIEFVVSELTRTTAIHALTIGVIGTMTVGMMARVSMGHTGREIRTSTALTAAFVAMNLSALIRLLEAVVPSGVGLAVWYTSGALFVLAFIAYLVEALRWLVSPRPDGRAG